MNAPDPILIRKVIRVQRQLLQDLGREPTVDELADRAEVTPARVREILRVSQQTVSLEQPTGDDSPPPGRAPEQDLEDPEEDLPLFLERGGVIPGTPSLAPAWAVPIPPPPGRGEDPIRLTPELAPEQDLDDPEQDLEDLPSSSEGVATLPSEQIRNRISQVSHFSHVSSNGEA